MFMEEIMKNISLELYRTFWAVGKTLNITKAARLLFITQPGVSLALKSLEEQLNTPLCVRSSKGVTLTAEGQVLFEEIDKAFLHIETAERKVDSLLNLDSGFVSISAGDTVCNYFLMPLLTAFSEKHPEVRIEITNRTSLETADLVCQRKAELGFVNMKINDERLRISPCMDITNVLVAGKKYSHLAQKPLPLSELSRFPVIMLERKSSSRLQMDEYLEAFGITPDPVFELGSIELMINFVRNNHGLSFIPFELCGHLIDGETLFRVDTDPGLPQALLAMIELKNIPVSHAAYQFKKFVLENIRF